MEKYNHTDGSISDSEEKVGDGDDNKETKFGIGKTPACCGCCGLLAGGRGGEITLLLSA